MATTIIDVHNSAMQLTKLLAGAVPSAEIIIADGNTLLARIVRPVSVKNQNEPKPRVPGLNRGLIEVRDDFDDPLPDEFWFGDETSS